MSRSYRERQRRKRLREERNAARRERIASLVEKEVVPVQSVPQSVFCRVKRQKSSVWQSTYSGLLATRQIGETYMAVDTVELSDGTTIRKLVEQVSTRRERPNRRKVDGTKSVQGSESHIEAQGPYSRKAGRRPKARAAFDSYDAQKKTDAKTGAVYYVRGKYTTTIDPETKQAKRVERFPQEKLSDAATTGSLRARVNAIRSSSVQHGAVDTRIGNTAEHGPMVPVPSRGRLSEAVELQCPAPLEKRQQMLK